MDFTNRSQLLGVAAQMMRRILSTHGTKRGAEKRGGDVTLVYLSDLSDSASAAAVVFDELDQALDRPGTPDKRQAKVMELRVFGGLTAEETAEFLGVSLATVHRDWLSGRIWLAKELAPAGAR